MGARWEFGMEPLVLGFAVIVLRFVGATTAAAAPLPKDACALLTPAEIQAALAPTATIGRGVPDASALPLGIECTYTWGPRTKEWGQSALTILVLDASKSWPGLRPEVIQQGLLLKAKHGGPGSSEIGGIGDAAVFTFETRSSNGTAEAYVKGKGVHVSVAFHGGSALQDKDKVIALLKKATSRL